MQLGQLRGRDRGWRCRLQLEGEWHSVPSEIGGDGARHRGLSYEDAIKLADYHAARGRRVRLVDPEGREGGDVPKPFSDAAGLRLTMS
jgi:hypothetical protein